MVMQLVANAYLKRQAARRAIRGGQYARARLLASEAQRLHATAPGRQLTLLIDCLDPKPYGSAVRPRADHDSGIRG
jgi:hypothetical protein